MSSTTLDDLQKHLGERRDKGLYRHRRTLNGPQDVEAMVDGRKVLSFCSNDYLGLAADPRLIEALQEGAARYGVGSGASHLVNGHSRAHAELEEALADFTGNERALLFSTGYMANLGVLHALTTITDRKQARIFADRLNHASLIDAARLSGGRMQRYPHGSTDKLAQWLDDMADDQQAFIVTDGVFSMDGDLAPLDKLQSLAQQQAAWLILDDAHGFGVLGTHGGGCYEHFALGQSGQGIVIGTLGKAFGTGGAFIAGSDELIETLIQTARTYIYTTALPPALAHAGLTSLKLLREESWRRDHLHKLIRHFRAGAHQAGLRLLPSDTPIQPLVIGDTGKTVALADKLLEAGILITAIRPPTVPAGTSRLRITLSASHQIAHIDRLLDTLSRLMA